MVLLVQETEQEQLLIGTFAQAALLAHTGTATAMATMNVSSTTFVGRTIAGTSGLRLRRLPTAASQVFLAVQDSSIGDLVTQ